MNTQYKILAQSANACVLQCKCCTQIQIQYKNIIVCLDWKDMITLIQKLHDLPPHSHYVINLIDLRETSLIKMGIDASGMFLTDNELDELIEILEASCNQVDLESIFKNSIHFN